MSAFTEANRKAFDDLASTYNTKPWQIRISQQVSSALQQRRDWLGALWTTPEEHEQTTTTTSSTPTRHVRLLDYACGTGSVTQALGSYVTTIRGIDISENMVTHYNEAARSSGLTTEQAHAVVGDLIGPEEPAAELSGPEFYNFDVAAIGLGFHHFEDPPLAVKRLGERLKAETGVLIIVDFLPFEHNPDAAAAAQHNHGHGGEQHTHSHSHDQHGTQQPVRSAQHTIKHNGFTSAGIQRLFASAGLTEDFAFDVLPEPAVFDFPEGRKERTLFIAKARKGPTFWNKVKTWVNGSLDAIGGQTVLRTDDGGSGAFQPRKDVGDGGQVFQPRRGVADADDDDDDAGGSTAFQPRRDGP